jgi:hypothetical protein
MNKSFSKIRHIQEANYNLEKRILSEKGSFGRGDKNDDMDLGGDKYNEMIRRISDYDKNPTYTDLTMEEPHNYPHLKYTVMKVDNCDKNSFFMTPTLDMVMINYCNYDGESTIEELNRKEDSMWLDMMSDIKRQFNNKLDKRGLPHRY